MMKIILSKSQWEMIGEKTGWFKKAEVYTNIPFRTVEYRGFTIELFHPEISKYSQRENPCYYKINGILREGNSINQDVALAKARLAIDNIIRTHPDKSTEQLLKELEPYKIKMLPGQASYTPEEWDRVQKLISDAARGDPGEQNEKNLHQELV